MQSKKLQSFYFLDATFQDRRWNIQLPAKSYYNFFENMDYIVTDDKVMKTCKLN